MKLEEIGVNKGHEHKLNKKGIFSVEDLLNFLPRKYNDCSHVTGFLGPDEESCIIMILDSVAYYAKKGKKGSDMVLARGRDKDTGMSVSVQWFNQYWMCTKLQPMLKQEVFVCGKAVYDASYRNYSIANPSVFTDDIADGMQIYPIYSKIEGVSNFWLMSMLNAAENTYAASEETIPPDILARYGLPGMDETYRCLHHPKTMADVQRGKYRVLFNDLLDFSLRNEYAVRQNCVGSQYNIRSMALYNAVRANIPFTPTSDQETAIASIMAMGKSGKRINALVCGDVGSGKTFVAQMAAALFAGSGYQVVVLAPTQILAKQHYEDFKVMFSPFGVNVVMLDNTLKKKAEKQKLLDSISSGEAQIVVGTHSVFSEGVTYKNLGLAIADEEHKFGVCQRNALIAKASEGVHVISMSATPIPRSLATVMYGDTVQLLSIESLPAGRLPVVTGIARNREAIYNFLYAQVKKGRQAYVVCPMIEKNDKMEGVLSVEEIYAEYTKAFAGTGTRIAVLTGKTPKDEMAEIIGNFKDGNTDILISTTVVEVGVNVPNATVMVIHNADRFGLAGLHQLRGRVGRGKYQSYCVLDSEAKDGQARERLDALCRTNNGYEIAQFDLQLRGAGALLGTQQSGKNKYLGLAIAYPDTHAQTKEAAAMLLDRGLSCCKATAAILTDQFNEVDG